MKKNKSFVHKKVRSAGEIVLSSYRNKLKTHGRKIIAILAVFAMVISFGNLDMVSAANPHIATIAIDSLTDDNGTHTAPYNFSCPNNPLFNPVSVAGSGTLTNPAGQIGQYHYSVDWGDGSTTVGQTFSGSDPYSFSFNFGPHTYTTSGSFSIIAKVYHAQSSGQDTTDAETIPITVCVHVPPPASASVTVNKVVINDNGGTAVASNYTLMVDGTTVTNGVVADFTVASAPYNITETGPAGYAATFSGDCDANGVINSVVAGQHYECTITNNDTVAPPPTTGTLTVIKQVTNDNGGDSDASDFSLHVKSGGNDVAGSPQAGSGTGSAYTLAGGSYVVSEDADSGYSPSFSGDCDAQGNVVVVNGQSKTCTITNNDIQPTITVVKVVDNTNGGSLVVSNFPLFVDATVVVSGTPLGVNAGVHVVSETNQPNYVGVFTSGSCNLQGMVTLAVGQNLSCTLTNTFNPPAPTTGTLTVIKEVVNDNSGDSDPEDFTLHVKDDSDADVSGSSFPGSGTGTSFILDPGTYSVSEDAFSGYTQTSISGDCEQGNVTIVAGEDYTCTVTNNDNAPTTGTLTVIKEVINDDSGDSDASDFMLHVEDDSEADVAGSPFPGSGTGTSFTLLAGDYTLSEEALSGYTQTGISGDCNSDGAITIVAGEDYTCTITNDDNARGGGNFTLNVFISNAPTDGEGSVTDDSNGDINCDSVSEENICSDSYPAGTVVTLTANPHAGSTFEGSWVVGAGTCMGATNPCQVTMNSNQTVSAHFSLTTPPPSGGGGGGGGGGTIILGGGGGTPPPPGQVLGESTGPGVQAPAPTPAVAGAATTQLPRTGLSLNLLGLLFAAGVIAIRAASRRQVVVKA